MQFILKVRESFTRDVIVEANNKKEAKDKLLSNGLSIDKSDNDWEPNPDTFEIEEIYEKENYYTKEGN